jgi:serine/threonine protein kinase
VTEATGRPLATLGPAELDDELLEGIWRNAGRLHALGVAHRQLDAARILVRPDGAPAFGDFGAATVAAAADIAADRAQVPRRVHARARRHGVAEAAYTAGLVALGVPNAPAMSTAIAFRLVTYYLPPLWGAAAMRWLRRHAYL